MRRAELHQCGCGCGAEPRPGNRYVHGHNARTSPEAYRVDENGCWVWLCSYWSKIGRPRLKRGGKWVIAYRAYYEDAKGSIPEGLTLDHLCKNKACVNPDHLEPTAHRENMRRADKVKLEPATVAAIRSAPAGLTYEQIGATHGISANLVHVVLRGTARSVRCGEKPMKVWRDIPEGSKA